MSVDDGKARGKDWTPLQVPDFPLCYWSSQLFYLPAAVKSRSLSVTRSSGYARGTLPFSRPRNYSLRPNSRLLRKLQEGMRGYVLFGILFLFLFECSTSKLTGTATKKLHIKTQLLPGFSLNQVAPYTKEIDKITSSYFFEIFTHILLKCRLCIRINL